MTWPVRPGPDRGGAGSISQVSVHRRRAAPTRQPGEAASAARRHSGLSYPSVPSAINAQRLSVQLPARQRRRDVRAEIVPSASGTFVGTTADPGCGRPPPRDPGCSDAGTITADLPRAALDVIDPQDNDTARCPRVRSAPPLPPAVTRWHPLVLINSVVRPTYRTVTGRRGAGTPGRR